MEKKRRKLKPLDEVKKREVCAILASGCSRRVAARYVGCSPMAIVATASREEAFRLALEKAEQRAEIEYMRNIQEAAKKSQYWRAAAWALERRNPQEYAARSPDTMTFEQVRQLLMQFAEIVIEEVPAASQRKKVLYRLGQLISEHGLIKSEDP